VEGERFRGESVRRRTLLRSSVGVLVTAILAACGSNDRPGAGTSPGSADTNATATGLSAAVPATRAATSGVPSTQPPATVAPISGGGQRGYLYQGPFSDGGTGVSFIQWTEVNGQLSGRVTKAILQGDAVQTDTTAFTGLHSGTSVTLNYAGLLSESGILDRNTLTMRVQDRSTGRLTPLVFLAATEQDYNDGVDSLRRQRDAKFAAVTATARAKPSPSALVRATVSGASIPIEANPSSVSFGGTGYVASVRISVTNADTTGYLLWFNATFKLPTGGMVQGRGFDRTNLLIDVERMSTAAKQYLFILDGVDTSLVGTQLTPVEVVEYEWYDETTHKRIGPAEIH
jgi:hypothetical protein